MKILKNRTYNMYELYYRHDGVKRSVLVPNKSEAGKARVRFERARRKFLGMRPVSLVEVIN